MSTIEELKKQAMDELAQENAQESNQTKTTQDKQVSEETEILASKMTFEQLQILFEKDMKETNEANIKGILADESKDMLTRITEVNAYLSESKKSVLQQVLSLPRFILYKDNNNTQYLIPVPEKVSAPKQTTNGTRSNNFVCPFQSGDKIQLVHGDIKSEIYTYSPAGAIAEDGTVNKFSQIVGAFLEHQLNRKVMRLKTGNGYNIQGISHPYWTAVS